jgi:hypothetical protein
LANRFRPSKFATPFAFSSLRPALCPLLYALF